MLFHDPTRPGPQLFLLSEMFRVHGRPCRASPRELVRPQDAPMADLIRVADGCLRCCAVTAEGRRHVSRFAERGDVLGVEAPGRWRFAVEAVGHAEYLSLPLRRLEAALRADPRLWCELHALACAELALRDRHLHRLSHPCAQERLLRFLEDRAAERASPDGWTVLPMTRADIAGHLGMTTESVSRGFGALRQHGELMTRGHHAYRLAGAEKRSRAA